MVSVLSEYQNLKVIWWVLMGILYAAVMIMDGFASGVLAMLPFVGRNNVERRVVINTIGPIWEANQVWLILFGGALFAAWPMVYGVICGSFYLAIFILLFCLILRPVGFKLRNKIDNVFWRGSCDVSLFFGGFVPPLLLGVVAGNLLLGVGFEFSPDLRPKFAGNILNLLNPFALVCGLINVAVSVRQGAIYLCGKTEDVIAGRAKMWFYVSNIFFIALFSAVVIWTSYMRGYVVVSPIMDFAMQPNPIGKVVSVVTGGWMKRYTNNPSVYLFLLLPYISFIITHGLLRFKRVLAAFFAAALSPLGVIFSLGAAMYPILLPSNINPSHSLLIWDSSSSQRTLYVMTLVVLVFLPCVLAYTAWVYRVFNYKITAQSVLNAGNDEAY